MIMQDRNRAEILLLLKKLQKEFNDGSFMAGQPSNPSMAPWNKVAKLDAKKGGLLVPKVIESVLLQSIIEASVDLGSMNPDQQTLQKKNEELKARHLKRIKSVSTAFSQVKNKAEHAKLFRQYQDLITRYNVANLLSDLTNQIEQESANTLQSKSRPQSTQRGRPSAGNSSMSAGPAHPPSPPSQGGGTSDSI
jgi:hypothetical protein